jgi:iduronate 2-sulfatase
MRLFFLSVLIGSVLLSCSQNSRNEAGTDTGSQKPNILFVAVDDLRPELNCYGQNQIHSPNIDKFAESGVTFTRAYCNVPVCGASRASLLTGIRPTYNRFLQYYAQADVETPEAVTIPEHFKNHGYTTISIGKIFHTPADNEERAWSETPFRYDHHKQPDGSWSDQGWQNYITEENLSIAKAKNNGAAKPWEVADVSDTVYFDGKYAVKAIEYLKKFKESREPFFLGVGFLKPHLPFNAPKKYWDLYNRQEIDLADNPFLPKDAPPQAKFNWGELRAYSGIPKEGPVSDSVARTLVHGYYACVSATDALIGMVLDELGNLGLAENTIVVLWGDHGWNLGEHGFWCKHVNFETSLRSTLLVAGPGINQGRAEGIVEFVDIYPTLINLCNLPAPKHTLQGISMQPILSDPSATIKEFAISKWMKGVTLIDDQYFYTEWHDQDRKQVGRMLYDHQVDPNENVNISESPERQGLVNRLSNKLNENLPVDYWQAQRGFYPDR